MEHKHNLKYSKRLDDPMTLKELEIWHSQEIEMSTNPNAKKHRGKTFKETSEELRCSPNRIARTKRKSTYNSQTQAFLEGELDFSTKEYAKGLVELTKATKKVNIRVPSKVEGKIKGSAFVIERVEEPENNVRFNALVEIGDIFGAKAPKQIDLKHSMQALGDDELIEGYEQSAKEIEENANTRRKITGSLDAGACITNATAFAGSEVAVEPREHAEGATTP